MRRRRWGDLSDVERVGLYTRQSLYLLLLGFDVFVVVTAASRLEGASPAATAVLIAGGLAVTAAGLSAMYAALREGPPVRALPRGRLAVLVVTGAAFVVAGLLVADEARGAAVMTTTVALALTLGLVPDDRVSGGLVAGAAVFFWVTTGETFGLALGLGVGVVFVFTARASMWLYGIVAELDVARRAQGQLAVAEERLRFSRDVHDVLGRRLSTIAVQAELAATLADRGDERAGERMLEVRGVAHEALREARELARGYRRTDLATELEGARSLLGSAGIAVDVRADELPRAWHEPAGWVVREAVTNVLRHSAAERVVITAGGGELRVGNDGTRPRDGDADHRDATRAVGAGEQEPAAPTGGAGLRGLRERLEPLGAALETGPDGEGRWLVVARFPGTGPLAATSRETT